MVVAASFIMPCDVMPLLPNTHLYANFDLPLRVRYCCSPFQQTIIIIHFAIDFGRFVSYFSFENRYRVAPHDGDGPKRKQMVQVDVSGILLLICCNEHHITVRCTYVY